MRYGIWRSRASLFLVLICLWTVDIKAQDKTDWASAVRAQEKQLVEALNRSMTCTPYPHEAQVNVICTASYRGLKIEFVNVNQPNRTVYVTAMGPKQILHAVGTKCLSVRFLDEGPTGGSALLLRNDGVFEPYFENDQGYARCGSR
jgi:hypothetical protein